MFHGPIEMDGSRPVAPAAIEPARFPEDFGRRFAVFVDTEEEFDWSKPFERRSRATSAMAALPDMQARLEARGVTPTYLVDHPIATDPTSVAILRGFAERGACHIGAHLHPWVNPPFDEAVSDFNSFAGNLPAALERAKIAALTDAIGTAFGARPTVYRAGRYGIGPNTPAVLTALGYRVDASARPLFDYRGQGGPDFRRAPHDPHWIEQGTLLEIPLSATFVGRLRRRGGVFEAASGVPRGQGLLARTGLIERVSLTPEGMPLADVLRAIDGMIDDGRRLFSLSFHSPSLAPGHTPYVCDAADLALFHGWWDGVLDFMARRGIAPASTDEILAAAQAGRDACQAETASAIAAAGGACSSMVEPAAHNG